METNGDLWSTSGSSPRLHQLKQLRRPRGHIVAPLSIEANSLRFQRIAGHAGRLLEIGHMSLSRLQWNAQKFKSCKLNCFGLWQEASLQKLGSNWNDFEIFCVPPTAESAPYTVAHPAVPGHRSCRQNRHRCDVVFVLFHSKNNFKKIGGKMIAKPQKPSMTSLFGRHGYVIHALGVAGRCKGSQALRRRGCPTIPKPRHSGISNPHIARSLHNESNLKDQTGFGRREWWRSLIASWLNSCRSWKSIFLV